MYLQLCTDCLEWCITIITHNYQLGILWAQNTRIEKLNGFCTLRARDAPTSGTPSPGDCCAQEEERNKQRGKSNSIIRLLLDSLSVMSSSFFKSTSMATIIQYNVSWTNLTGSHRCYQSLPGQLSVSRGRASWGQTEALKWQHGCFLRNVMGSSEAGAGDEGETQRRWGHVWARACTKQCILKSTKRKDLLRTLFSAFRVL